MKNDSPPKLLIVAVVTLFLISALLFLKTLGLTNISLLGSLHNTNTGLLTIFLIGLISGGVTCLAVQGGLLAASTIATREQHRLQEKTQRTGALLPIVSFLGAKLVAYTILGIFLGSLGSIFELSLTAKALLQIAVALFMLGTAGNLLQIHPLFRYCALQPPRVLTRAIRNQSKSSSLFAPLLLGAFTVFIPCGTTQAMMALAIASGNPILGGAMLFSFVLGTSPLFFILGYCATKLGEALNKGFMKFAAFSIILLALYNLEGGLALLGSPVTFSTLLKATRCISQNCTIPTVEAASTEETIYITNSGYSPSSLSVKTGSTVTLHLVNNEGGGCAQAFTIPSLGVQRLIKRGANDTIQFKAPEKPTELAFMCSMGMYRGTIHVL